MSKILSILLTTTMLLSAFIMSVSAVEEIDDIADFGGDYYFLCESDKDMLSYMPGDSVIFTVKLFGRNKQVTVPYLLYTIERDDGVKTSGTAEPNPDGTYTISDFTMDIPGYVRLLIDFPDKNGNKNWSVLKEHQRSAFEGGVLVDVENITTVHEIPDDFMEFWDDSLALLDDFSPDPFELKLVEDTVGYSVYEVYINCYGDPTDLKSGDTFAAGYLNVPKNKKAGSLPLKMTFQGYGVRGASISSSNTQIILNMCAHSFRLGLDEYDVSLLNLPSDSLGNYGWSPSENADPENVYYRNMVLRNVQAARFLMKYFGDEDFDREVIDDVDTSAWKGLWNGVDFEASGGSQGGFQSISLGALCPQISKINANVPAYGNLAAGGYTNPTGDVLGSLSVKTEYVDGLDYCDTAFFAYFVNCDFAITGGMGDMTCSPTGLMAMYNNARRGKNINISISFQQGETHMFKPDPNMVESTLAVYKSEVTDWSVEDGVLNVSGNGVLSTALAEVNEWNEKIEDVKEINISGNITGISENVFSLKNGANVFIKTFVPMTVSPDAFCGNKDVVLYCSEASGVASFAEAEGLQFSSLGTFEQGAAFFYIIEGDTLRINSVDRTKSLATTSGDTALVNFMKDNAEIIKNIEIRGEFSSIGNMQPAFSKLTNVASVKIDSRNTTLSGEKNFMGLSALETLGHYDFVWEKPTTYSDGIVNLTGFNAFIADTGKATVPAYILSGCKAIKSVVMPGSLMSEDADVAGLIGEKAFADCSLLRTVEFPESVTLTSLDFGVFSQCMSLEKVIVKGEVSKSFSCTFNIATIHSFAQVPETAVFEVGSDEFAEILNTCFSEGGVAIKAVSNDTYKGPANQDDEMNCSGGEGITIIVIAVSAVAVAALAVIVAVVLRKKKVNK